LDGAEQQQLPRGFLSASKGYANAIYIKKFLFFYSWYIGITTD